MTSSTRVSLPVSVRSDRLLQLMARLMDVPLVPTVFSNHWAGKRDDTPTFDPLLPSAKDNPWHLAMDRKHERCPWYELPDEEWGTILLRDLSHAPLFLVDPLGGEHQWMVHQEISEGPEKIVSAYLSPLTMAIGERVVCFFGGTLIYSDESSQTPLQVANRAARFPIKKAGQTSDERWYQFQNALASETPLLATDLERVAHRTARGLADFQALHDWLGAQEDARRIANVLPAAAPAKRQGKRL